MDCMIRTKPKQDHKRSCLVRQGKYFLEVEWEYADEIARITGGRVRRANDQSACFRKGPLHRGVLPRKGRDLIRSIAHAPEARAQIILPAVVCRKRAGEA